MFSFTCALLSFDQKNKDKRRCTRWISFPTVEQERERVKLVHLQTCDPMDLSLTSGNLLHLPAHQRSTWPFWSSLIDSYPSLRLNGTVRWCWSLLFSVLSEKDTNRRQHPDLFHTFECFVLCRQKRTQPIIDQCHCWKVNESYQYEAIDLKGLIAEWTSVCLCILMIFLCKILFTDQESNVHYYLFSHDHCYSWREDSRLLFVIISIIVEQIKHLKIIIKTWRREILPRSEASIRWRFSSPLFDSA